MAESHPDIQSILAALAAQRPPTGASSQTPPGPPGQSYPPPSSSVQPPHYQAPPPGATPAYGASGHGLPAPASSGNLDLSAIRPVTSGTMNFDDIVSKARTYAADNGATSYDRPLVYGADARNSDRNYRRSRSRSPRGDYRDERRSGAGRDYGRDRSFSPPSRSRFSPRSGGGGARDRSPLRGGDDNSETIQIESSLVGLIIGRQGENLRRIEADTNCRVQFLAATDGGPFRQCRISGPRPRRAEVKDAINRIIEDSGMGALNRPVQDKSRDSNKGGATALRDGEDHMQIMVPDRTVGLIIGRGGETIRDLQERSGCHINIVGESKSVNGLRPVNLIGTVEAAARAKDFIMEIVDSDTRGDGPAAKKVPAVVVPRSEPPPREATGSAGPDKINDSVYVPSDAVGMIIGKGGETIRDMQNTTGCKINVAQSSGPGETQREIALIGTRDSIARAKMAIDEKVDAVRQKSGSGAPSRSRGHQDHDRPSYSQGPDTSSTNQPPASSGGDASDPYAQYGGYQNYVALWYQSLMYQQQQQNGDGSPAGAAPAPGS
ncbi:far upstream element-binding protein 2 [Metarhizium rileyi]|uniref:Far upstream element-binding protein 2 n=1 Tax=Metarhizium rileyi (strain RCEF 4871) TaxID=1649241 RepID=A0A162JHA1_METRR|nr:far upstream element-binding protein 2 [Metarhizium rileyi RCEF 4871]